MPRPSSQIVWTQDMSSTASRLYSALVANGPLLGVPSSLGSIGNPKVWVAVDATSAGTTSCTVSLYGYAVTGPLNDGRWLYIKTLNGGSSLTPNSSTNSPAANRVTYAEAVDVQSNAFVRYGTAAVIGGTTPTVSTYVGLIGA